MTVEPQSPVRFRTCGLTLDVDRWELRNAKGESVELAPLSFRLLAYLIEHRERVVPKDELFRVLWGDVAVTDGSLTQAIWTVRRVLNDDGATPRIVQNVRGRGYRFTAAVEAAPDDVSVAAKTPSTAPAIEHGRAVEQALLDRAIADAISGGRGRAVLISGGAGIGKTWLASHTAARAVALGALLCEGCGYEDQSAPALWPLRQLVLRLVRNDPALAGTLSTEHAADLCTLAPELASLLPARANAPLRPQDEQRFFVSNAVIALLEHVSRASPLVLVLEDLHWIDDATLVFLERLAGELQHMRVLLLCSYRDDSKPALRRAVAGFSRDSGTLLLPLAGLPADAVQGLLTEHGVVEINDRLLARALLVTSGNPLFVIQLARYLVRKLENAAIDPETVVLPEESRAVLLQQVEALPPRTRDCLRVAAALGDDFHVSDLGAAIDVEHDALLALLAPANAARLLALDNARPFTCRFGHPSIRSAIYENIEPLERARIHLRIAEALEGTVPDSACSRLSAIVHHYHEAAAVGGAENAARLGMLAAHAAYRVTAYEDTIAHCQRVVGVLQLTRRADPMVRYEAELLRGHALRLVGAGSELVREAYAHAASAALEANDPIRYAHAAMSFAGRGPLRLLILRAAGTVEPREIAMLERTLELLPDDDCPTRALAEGWIAYSLYNAVQEARKAELSRRSVSRARRCGDTATLVECLLLSQFTDRRADALPERIETLREAAQRAASADLREHQMDATEELAWSLFEAGDAEGAELQMRAVVRLAEALGRPHDRRKEIDFRVMRLDAAGRYAETDALLAEGRARSSWPPERINQGEAIRTFMQRFQQGRCGETIASLEALAKQYPLPVAWHCGLTNTYATVGRLDDARRELDRLAAGDFAAIPDDHNRITSYSLLAHATYLLRDPLVASSLRTKLTPYAGRNTLQGVHGCYFGPVSRVLAMLDVVVGDYDRAELLSDAAIARDRELGATIGEVWSRLLRVELHLARDRRSDRQRAADQLQCVQSLLRGLDLAFLVSWTARLAGELASRRSVRFG